MAIEPLVPVTVVGGYLGAGKTTLINAVLADPGGRRIAVLVNDFGAVNVDAALIAEQDGDTIELTNGCLCCSIADALGDGLDAVLDRKPRPDQIVIEASGAANPAKIAIYGQGWPGCRLDAVVVVTDAEVVRDQVGDAYVGALVTNQIEAADLVVVSRLDLVEEHTGAEVVEWLVALSAGAPVVSAVRGAIDPAVLFEPRGSGGGPLGSDFVAPRFTTTTFTVKPGLSVTEIEAVVADLPATTVRAKGIVESDGALLVVQRVGRRVSVEPASLHLGGAAAIVGTIVVIANG